MPEHELVLVATWREMPGFALFEPSIKVLRGGAALDDDKDTVVVSAIMRKHECAAPP